MDDNSNYAVFFFPQALEALGEAMKPYLQDGPGGAHVVCHGIDTSGSLIEMNLTGASADGKTVQIELMVPSSMIRMIVSAHSDELFGFGPRDAVQKTAPVQAQLGDAPPAPGSVAGNADESAG